jgi:hypothetical protein
MSNPDNYSTPSADPSELAELRQTCHVLRTQIAAVVICLVVFNFSMNIFIFKQLNYVNRQVAGLNTTLAGYRTNNVPMMDKFVAELRTFANTNRVFYDTVYSKFLLEGAKTAHTGPTNSPPKSGGR